MLPKQFRLNLTQNFKWAASGKRVELPSMVLFLKIGSNEVVQVGVSLKKSTFNKAVLRNQVKRKLYTAIKLLIPFFPNTLNLIIMPKSSALDKTINELEQEIKDGTTEYITN